MHFEIVGPIINVETIAVHREIRQLQWLNRTFGRARWRKLKGVAVVRLPNGRMPCGIKKILEEAAKRPRYVVCLENKGHRGSLETRKVYRALADAKGERAGLVRIIDESGEDYLYPTRWFARVSVPAKAKKALERAGV